MIGPKTHFSSCPEKTPPTHGPACVFGPRRGQRRTCGGGLRLGGRELDHAGTTTTKPVTSRRALPPRPRPPHHSQDHAQDHDQGRGENNATAPAPAWPTQHRCRSATASAAPPAPAEPTPRPKAPAAPKDPAAPKNPRRPRAPKGQFRRTTAAMGTLTTTAARATATATCRRSPRGSRGGSRFVVRRRALQRLARNG